MRGTVLKREEAISVVKELLDCCLGLDGHPLEVAPPNTPSDAGYQIIVRMSLDEKTRNCVHDIVAKHQLAYQSGSMWKTRHTENKEPDTLIIYKPENSPPRPDNRHP
jgi:hypothetical protein